MKTYAYIVKIGGEVQPQLFFSKTSARISMMNVDGGYEIVQVEIKEISSEYVEPA